MRNRVMITNTTYKVDKENKVVVCELKCDLQFSKHPAWYVMRSEMWIKKFPDIGYIGEFTVKAKARCNSQDTFDEKKGKMIAESRAKLKMYSIAERLYSCCIKALKGAKDSCLDSLAACIDVMQIEKRHIKELTK